MGVEKRVKDALERVGRFSVERRKTVFAVVAVVILLSALAASATVQMQMGMDLYIDDDSEEWEDWSYLKEEFDEGNNVFVVVESDDLYHPRTVRAVDRLDGRYSSVDDVRTVVSLADVVKAGNDGRIPETRSGVERAVERFESTGNEELVDNLVPRNDMTIMLAPYGDVGTLDTGEFMPTRGSDIIYSDFRDETEFTELPPGTSVTVTGQPVFENAAFGLMLPEMIMLFAGSFGVILVVVYLIMRGKLKRGREVLLPLGTAMVALVAMMGVMGVLNYNFNAIMLGVMPIALGLGIDYGLQVQTRYIEERRGGALPVDAAGITSRTTGKAILLAMGTTAIGLGSLFVSDVPPVRQFGVTSASSVVASMALSITLLPALLATFDAEGETENEETERDAPPAEKTSEGGELIEGLLRRLGNVVCARPNVTIAVMLLVVLSGAWAYPQVEPKQEMMDFWPQDLEEKNDLERLEDNVESPKVMYVIVEGDDIYTPEKFRQLDEYRRVMTENPNVNYADGPVERAKLLNGGSLPETQEELDATLAALEADTAFEAGTTDEPTHAVVSFFVDDVSGEEVRTLIDEFEGNADVVLEDEVRVTGKPVLNRNVIENVTAGLTPMTLLSFGLGLIFLTLAFWSARVALVLVAGVAASAALMVTGAMYVLGIPWNPLTVTMSSMALGIGIDYGIHVYERYEEEVLEGEAVTDAVVTSLEKLARPILGSSVTTMTGFGVLMLSRFPVLSNFGKTVFLVILMSLVATFVILPAVLTAVTIIKNGRRCRI
ncbi:MAG: hydrophobe/amphiphile efflux-3 (HAE3) family transporter [Halobacteriales archaeon]|nr:hydrophobe/amphiphile efflux-3 (HAE3) family transporter [Halobacteriales archaeon]